MEYEYNNQNDSWLKQPYEDCDEDRLAEGCLQSGLLMIILAVIIGIALMFNSCTTTQYVPVINHHTDTLIQTKVQHDSIYINDSTVITEKGDTVKIEKWHTKYVEKQVHDTTYISKTDTIPKPYPVKKEVPAELTWWQQTRIHIANILLLAVLATGVGWLVKKKW